MSNEGAFGPLFFSERSVSEDYDYYEIDNTNSSSWEVMYMPGGRLQDMRMIASFDTQKEAELYVLAQGKTGMSDNIGSIAVAVKGLADKIDKLSALRAVLEEASTKRDHLMTRPAVFINLKIQTEGGRVIEVSVDPDHNGKCVEEMVALINQMLSDRAHNCIVDIERIAAEIAG